MLGNLKTPPEPFEDIIRTHFKLKAKAITKQLDKWLAADDRMSTQGANSGGTHREKATATSKETQFEQDCKELKALLAKL